jgi:hypothetical protein
VILSLLLKLYRLTRRLEMFAQRLNLSESVIAAFKATASTRPDELPF